MRTLTCKVPEKLDAEVAALAREEGVTKSEIVRRAVEAQLARRQRVFHRGNGKKFVSAYDLVGHLAGSVKVPADILTNPKYMEGFGE